MECTHTQNRGNKMKECYICEKKERNLIHFRMVRICKKCIDSVLGINERINEKKNFDSILEYSTKETK
jgi:hypothetical protein